MQPLLDTNFLNVSLMPMVESISQYSLSCALKSRAFNYIMIPCLILEAATPIILSERLISWVADW